MVDVNGGGGIVNDPGTCGGGTAGGELDEEDFPDFPEEDDGLDVGMKLPSLAPFFEGVGLDCPSL